MTKKITIGGKKPLVKDLLFVEGITRAGKFLLANILAGFDGIEPVQNFTLLEKIPVFVRFGLMDKKAAAEILRCEIDIHCYEMFIGRNINHRLSDKSSIFNHPRHKEFLKRGGEPDGDTAMARFYKEKPLSFFIMHEVMPNIDIYFSLFPKLKVVHIQRSPVDLVHSLFKRGYGRRMQNDPRFWMIPFQEGRVFFPWYVYPRQKKYFEASEIDKVILSVINLVRLYKNKFRTLSARDKKKILVVSYEDIVREPRKVVNKIAIFLRKKPSPQMPSVLKREDLPNPSRLDSIDERTAEIKELASPLYFNTLMKLQKEYKA